MLPLRDDIPGRAAPLVTAGLICATVVAFLYQAALQWGPDPGGARAAREMIAEFGAVPCRLTGWLTGAVAGECGGAGGFPHPAVTVVSSMFLHAGPLPAGGSMLYLWIFGNGVEDTLGHGRFLVFYVGSGAAAIFAQMAVTPASPVPIVGAAGAVSGVLGAYLLLFPHARILTLVTFGFLLRIVRMPALIVLAFWVVLQCLDGFATFFGARGDAAGMTWLALAGGFGAGIGLLFLLRRRAHKSL